MRKLSTDKSISDGLLQSIMVAAENAGITASHSRFLHFVSNLIADEVFIVDKDNVCVLSADGSFNDSVEFICLNGAMVQINLVSNRGEIK